MPKPTGEIPPKLKDAAEKEAKKLGGQEFYVIWNDVRYGPFVVQKK